MPAELTNDQKIAFLATLAQTGNVTRAARAIQIERSTAYKHKRKDPRFAEAWGDAENAALDTLEAALRDRALNGVEKGIYHKGELVDYETQYSDGLGKWLLDRKRYGESRKHDVKHTHMHLVKLSDAQLEAAVAKAISGGSELKQLNSSGEAIEAVLVPDDSGDEG